MTGAKVYQEDLLAIDVFAETRRLAKRCDDYNLAAEPQDFRLVHVGDLWAADRLMRAILLQGSERLSASSPESDAGRTLEVPQSFLVLALVRPDGPGPMHLTIGGRQRLVEGYGRAAFLTSWALLVPGMVVERFPWNVIVLGRRVTPSEAIMYYGSHGHLLELEPPSVRETTEEAPVDQRFLARCIQARSGETGETK